MLCDGGPRPSAESDKWATALKRLGTTGLSQMLRGNSKILGVRINRGGQQFWGSPNFWEGGQNFGSKDEFQHFCKQLYFYFCFGSTHVFLLCRYQKISMEQANTTQKAPKAKLSTQICRGRKSLFHLDVEIRCSMEEFLER